MRINKDLKRILDISISLSNNSIHTHILENILSYSMEISNCDGGTLYLYDEENDNLRFFIMRNKTMNTYLGKDGEIINLPPVKVDSKSVSGYSAKFKELVNIDDVYSDSKFNWEGPKKYDKLNNYHTKAVLVIPLLGIDNELLGIMQLLNPIDEKGEITSFNDDVIYIIKSLASLSAISISNRKLYDEIKELLDSFVKAMVKSIESRTPYNAFHTVNVSKLCSSFVDYLNENGYKISANDKEQLVMSAMLHDIGKIIIPLNILNKASRFEGKLEIMKMRWKYIKASIYNKYLLKEINKKNYESEIKYLDDATAFIISIDTKGFLDDDSLNKIKEIYKKEYIIDDNKYKIIEESEIDDALIRKGTLTSEERLEIEKHVVYTNEILKEIKFGSKYNKVLEIASNHHEYLDGSGYPNKLDAKKLDILNRIITIMDVYESLTSTDRPYKKPIPKDKALNILSEMVNEGKLDKKLVEEFKKMQNRENS